MKFSVIQLAMEEVDRLRNLRLRSLSQSPEAFCSTYQQIANYSTESWKQQLRDLPVFIAVNEDSDIGIIRCQLSQEEPETAQFYSLWVDPAFRGNGIGDLLIDAVVEWARDHHCKQLILDVIADNHFAQTLYQRKGFYKAGEFCALPRIKGNPLQVRMKLELAQIRGKNSGPE